MKFIAVTVVRGGPENGFQFQYPRAYNPAEIQHVKKGPLMYQGPMTQGDADSEEMLMLIKDLRVAAKLLADPSRRCRELTREEAEAWLAECPALDAIPDEVVSDPHRVALAAAFAATSIPLSQDDLDALNPDHPKMGVRRSPARTVAGIFGV